MSSEASEQQAGPDDDLPPHPALRALWDQVTDHSRDDSPHIKVWMPRYPPYAYVETIDRGCHELPELPVDRPWMVQLKLGGIAFGGYLDEMERLIDGAREALTLARYQADQLVKAHAEKAAPAPSAPQGETPQEANDG